RPNAEAGDVSGTRIGAALRLAVAAHDPRMQGAQDIILLSDGDDPVADNEWREGIDAAAAKKIPIHTVGLGTPGVPHGIPDGDGFLKDDKREKVTTRPFDEPLQNIA